jgi:hypothetical protein
MLYTIKLLYSRLSKDIIQYTFEIGKFQEYYQRFDLNNYDMLELMKKNYNSIANMLYLNMQNHLSMTTNVTGLGEKIIKPVNDISGITTTLKYQNVFKSCSDCDTGLSALKHSYSKDREYGERNFYKIKTTTNIATYDNISITQSLENNIVIGYILTIGELSYEIKNTKNSSILPYITISNNTDYITANSIEHLFNFIDCEIKNLSDALTALNINIEYVNKYIKNFETTAHC